MTTIAYKDGVIAYDSLETCGDIVSDPDKNKMRVESGVRFFLSGSTSDEGVLIADFLSNNTGQHKELNAAAIAWDGEKLWECGFCKEDGFWKVERRQDVPNAIGSGNRFAYGAMDFGATAREAVAISAKRHVHSGGRIRTYRLQ